ncbi:unnamed protein product [Rotaria magnacalcarata]|uniref:Uncharacterized protein n=3 Tax=Rotaria TaxID=231623 RepID=A0A8S2JLJ3_9BILA|nr:unnamed protein product [Rotaria magnacalcarata]CAF3813673.1 unnamed protein product [Rotaria magnacalcarata]
MCRANSAEILHSPQQHQRDYTFPMWGECRQKKHFEPFFVAYENRRLVIDQDAFDHHVTFIVHRLINSSSTSLPASSTIDHQADTPPPRARRSFWQYFRCTVGEYILPSFSFVLIADSICSKSFTMD